MARQTPQLEGLIGERGTGTQAGHTVRIDNLERNRGNGPVTIPGGGAALGEVVGTVPGTLTIYPLGTPQVARLGIGTNAHGSTALKLATAAISNRVVGDNDHGQDNPYDVPGASGLPGARWNIQHGTTTANGGPRVGSAEEPTFKVSRVQGGASENFQSGGSPNFSAIMGYNVADTDSTMQAIGVMGVGQSHSNEWAGDPVNDGNSDAVGIFGASYVMDGGTGVSMGAHFVGFNYSATGIAKGIEVQTRPLLPNAGTTFSTSGLSQACGIWMVLNDQDGGGGIEFSNFANKKWDYAISFKTANGGPSSIANIVDLSNTPTGIQIIGLHSTAALSIGSLSGQFLVGLTSSGLPTKALIKSGAIGDSALCVQAFSSSTTAAIFSVLNDAGSAKISFFNNGGIVLGEGSNYAFGTTTGTKFGTATTQKLGWWNATPVVQAAAYTQTYATATRTHAAFTAPTLTNSTGGTFDGTVADVGAAFNQATLNNNFTDITNTLNALRVDLVNAKSVLNQVIDDLQLYGLLA